MKIEEGKYYRTRDGRKAGPIQRVGGGKGHYYWHDGASFLGQFTNNWSRKGYSSSYPGLDIISEWKDEIPHPIRTVTRKEIVPGIFSRVSVGVVQPSYGLVAMVRLTDKTGTAYGPLLKFDATELREAAHILNQIAEALEND